MTRLKVVAVWLLVLAWFAGCAREASKPGPHAAPVVRFSPTATMYHARIPTWMRRECLTEWSVNCYWQPSRHGQTGPSAFIRLMPIAPTYHGPRLVCVLYIDRPAWDYCEAYS